MPEGIEDQLSFGWESAKQARNHHFAEHLHIARYVRPQLAEFFQERKTTDRPSIELLWDDTAIKANDMFARGLWSMAHNSATRWFSYKDEQANVNGDQEATDWYGRVNADLRSRFMAGGLYPALLMRLLDVGAFGFGAIYSYQKGTDGQLAYEYVPASECFYELGPDGHAKTFYRPLNLTARQAIDERQWPREAMPQGLIDAYERKDQATKFLFVHIVWPNAEKAVGRRPRNNREFEFAGYYYSPLNKRIVKRGGFPDMPYHVLSWHPQPGTPYPTGIGYITLPEIRNVNAQRKKYDRLLDLESDSPILVPNKDEQVAQRAMSPGERLYGGMTGDGKRLYEPYYTGNGSRTVLEEVRESRQIIQEAWHYSLMVMQTNAQMTAEEVRSRDAKLLQAMGPFIVMMGGDLEAIVDRQFQERLAAGAYDPLPAVFNKSTKMQLEFQGILAKAQMLSQSQDITGFYQDSMLIAAYDKEAVMMGVDHAVALRALGESRALPPGMVLSKEAYDRKMEENAEAKQQATMAAQAPDMARAARDGAAAIKDITAGNDNAERRLALAP